MSITHDVIVIMIDDDDMVINLIVLVDSVVDAVLICAENRQIVFIAVFNNILIYVFEILTNKEPNSSVAIVLHRRFRCTLRG
jgi:hypothetical protein